MYAPSFKNPSTTSSLSGLRRGLGRSPHRWLLLLLIIAPTGSFGAELSWDESCATGTWTCECMEEGQGSCTGTGFTNWTMDQLPGSGDTAVIGPAGLPVVLVSPHTTLDSIQAQRSLEVFPNLTLEGMSSSFHDLTLHPGNLIAGGTIQISGNSSLNRQIGNPANQSLEITASGTLNLNGLQLNGGVNGEPTFVNDGMATVSMNDIQIIKGSFINNNSLTLMPQQDFFGDQHQFENNGMLSIQPGGVMLFDPEYEQNSGSLIVQSGIANFRSRALHFRGGSVTIPAGGILEVQSPFVADIDGSFDGLISVNGRGVFVLREAMDVLQPLTLNLLSGCPFGDGFIIRGGRLTLHDELINTGTVNFEGGLMTGTAPFENRDCVAVVAGQGTIDVPTSNFRWFAVKNNLLLIGAEFQNRDVFQLRGQSAELGGVGRFRNFGRLDGVTFSGEGKPPGNFEVSARFMNEPNGRVHAGDGDLSFTGILDNLNSEILSLGKWRALQGGSIDFPTLVRVLTDGAEVCICGGTIPDLNFLEAIAGGALLTVTIDWGPLGTLVVNTRGKITTGGGPFRGDRNDGVVIRGPVGPVLTISNLINESGIVLPTEVGEVGTMQLVGNYQQQADGMLAVDLSLGGADLLSVDGDVELAGSLEIRRLDDVPAGTTVTVLTVTNGTLTGAFDQILAEDEYTLEYFPDHVEATLDKIIGPMLEDGFE